MEYTQNFASDSDARRTFRKVSKNKKKNGLRNRLEVCLIAFLGLSSEVHLILGEKVAYATVSPHQ